jgi:hypothetical protein
MIYETLSSIKKARRAIGRATPIKADCGLLCKKACCKSDRDVQGDELGMLLFPGEEKLLQNDPDIKIEEIEFGGQHVWFAVCGGSCVRAVRPLSCRIFPLLPYIPKSERKKTRPRFSVIPDPRAGYLCPLLHGKSYVGTSFYARVSDAAAVLIKNRRARRFLVLLSGIADEYFRFTGV